MTNKIIIFALGSSAFWGVNTSRAAIMVTYGSPGAMSATVAGAQVEDFNDPALLGKANNNVAWNGVGSISSVYVEPGSMYGGANGSACAVQSEWVGQPIAVPISTLTLNTPSAYFGLHWAAADSKNVLSFYENSILVGQINASQFLTGLPSGYNGNPSLQFKGLNYHEDFAFVNFFGTGGTTWDKVVFSNLGSTGFESDNWTTRVQPWGQDPNDVGNMPGTQALEIGVAAVPEVPFTGLFMGLGCLAIAGWNCRRKPPVALISGGLAPQPARH